MHNIYRITFVFITSNIILSSLKADLANQPVHDTLLDYSNKCPYLKTTKLLNSNPSYLDSCSDFSKLKNVAKITRESAYDITCILYTNNFMLLCNSSLDFQKIISNATIDKALELYNVTSACNTLQKTQLLPAFRYGEDIMTTLNKGKACTSICSEIAKEGITPICTLAAYSLFLVNTIPKAHVNTKSNIVEDIKRQEDSSTTDLQKPAQTQASAPDQPAKAVVTKPQRVIGSEQGKLDEESHKNTPDLSSNQKETNREIQPQPNPPHVDATPVENTPIQSDSNTQHRNEAVSDSLHKKTESIPPKPELQPELGVQSKNQNNQPTGTVTEKKLTKETVPEKEPPKETAAETKQANVDNPDLQENSNVEQEHPEPKQKNEDHVAETEEKKLETDQEKPLKSDINKEEKVPQVPPAIENSDREGQELPQENVDYMESDVDSNNIDPSKDIIPPQDAGETEVEDTKKIEKVKQTNMKPEKTNEDAVSSIYNSPNTDEEDSFFFIYFMMVCAVFILGYIGYHNKQKVLALVIEGRRGRRGSRRGRPNSANYHKLDSNLEEAVTSSCNKNTTNIIY